MNTAELNDLELQIDTLIKNLDRLKSDNQALRDQLASSTNEHSELQLDRLKADNHALRNQLASSASERSKLQEKNKKAMMQIRNIIKQLKEQMS